MKVKFVYSIYQNDTNNYCTFKYKDLDTGLTVTCIGYNLPTTKIKYNFDVEEIVHPTYGLQYKVNAFTECIDNDRDSIIEYLSSGLIKGIGRKIAERIFALYDKESINILINEPEKLLRVKGISRTKLDDIIDSYKENHIPNEIVIFLMPYGFTISNISEFYKVYKENTIRLIKENPYRLCNFKGVSFKMADSLGSVCGIKKTDYIRMTTAIIQTLRNDLFSGSVAMKKEDLVEGTKLLSGVYDNKFIWKTIVQAIKEQKISYRKMLAEDHIKQFIYLNNLKKLEEECVSEIIRLVKYSNNEREEADKLIDKTNDGIILDQTQKDAVLMCFENSLSITTGGPGTGKTTTIKRMITIFRLLHPTEPIYLMAPTGKAARRITESVEEPARTIHSQYELSIHNEEQIEYDEDIDKIESGLVIVDEFSMVDLALATKFFSGIKSGVRVMISGDKDQIPSVGPGNVLKDMINSGVLPVTFLKYEYRQDEGSTICENAHGMQDGASEFITGDDFICEYIDEEPELKNCSSAEKLEVIEKRMAEDYVRELNNPNNKSVICLSPYKNYAAGVYATNTRIQNIVNPANDLLQEFPGHNMVFRVGDPIMHIKVNYEDVVNGDVGIVKSIGSMDGEYTIICEYDTLDGKIQHEYTKKNINELTLAYDMTFHKTQGSEYDVVILCITEFHKRMLKRNILYTGITRAKKKVIFRTTNRKVVKEIIENNSSDERNTLLTYILRENYGDLYEQRKLSV